MLKKVSNLKAVVIGASGAVGREVVDCLIDSGKWAVITIIGRRKIDRWNSLPLSETKINFVNMENLDILGENVEKMTKLYPELNFEGYSAVFNCLGSRTKYGDEIFKKVDYTYVIYSAELCTKFNIPHFAHVTSNGANSKSCFKYLRVKGEVEDKLFSLNIKNLTILRPGFIKNRDNDERFVEQMFGCINKIFCGCFTSVEAKQIAKAMVYDSETFLLDEKKNGSFEKLENSKIIELSNESNKLKMV
jgi:oxidoreductase